MNSVEVNNSPHPVPEELSPYLNGASNEMRNDMRPLIDDCIKLFGWAGHRLEQNGLNPTTAKRVLNGETINGESKTDANNAFKYELAAEYRHLVHHVIGATLKLKTYMLKNNLPEHILAYQTGTGFPLPEEIEGKIRKIGMLKFGEGELEFVPKADFKRDDRPEKDIELKEDEVGMHFYEVMADNGKKMTLLALKGRFHGYSAVESGVAFPHQLLAILPRVLKGIGVDEVLTTFASGYDGVPREGQKTPSTGDYGYIINFADRGGEHNKTDPGVGIQNILGPAFGGPYQATADLANNTFSINRLEKAIKKAFPNGEIAGIPIPERHATLFYDASSAPHFENPAHWEDTRGNATGIMNTAGMLNEKIMAEIPSYSISVNQGMSSWPEIIGYNQNMPASFDGVGSVFNRKLKVTALAAFTDSIDPRTGGQSHHISDDAVREAGKRGAKFIAPVISEYAGIVAEKGPKPATLSDLFANYRQVLNFEDQHPVGNIKFEHAFTRIKTLAEYILKENPDARVTDPFEFYAYCKKQRDQLIKDYRKSENAELVGRSMDYEQIARDVAEILEIDHEEAFSLN